LPTYLPLGSNNLLSGFPESLYLKLKSSEFCIKKGLLGEGGKLFFGSKGTKKIIQGVNQMTRVEFSFFQALSGPASFKSKV
jgi:hypothetical protein